MWSTPSSRKAHVVAKSAEAGGIGKGALAAMTVVVVEGIVTVVSYPDCANKVKLIWAQSRGCRVHIPIFKLYQSLQT